jgi:hypothetical protein
MLLKSAPISAQEIEATMAKNRQKISVRRVLPKSVIISLHKKCFVQASKLSAAHKAIQTYTTAPMVPQEKLELLKALFSVKKLSTEAIADIAQETGLPENKIQALSSLLPHSVKKQLETTMEKLFMFGQATSRELPGLSLTHAQKMVVDDIRYRDKKLNQEIQEIFEAIHDGKILQVGIMLDVITSNGFPFCLLNQVQYKVSGLLDYHKCIECYVLLYAKKEFDENNELSNIAVWSQLFPVNPNDLDQMPQITSEIQYVRYPNGFVTFQFADTAVQVELSSLEQESFLLDAKPKKQLIAEMKPFVRTMTAPGKKKAGIALHVSFTYYPDKRIELKDQSLWV